MPAEVPPVKPCSLSNMSQLQISYSLMDSKVKPYLEILVIHYQGVYRDGSRGNGDATYMAAMAKAGISAFEPWGVIHDLSDLVYQWGDMLEAVFSVGPEVKEGPSAILVGPDCEEAVRTLVYGIHSSEKLEDMEGFFFDLESAWHYVADRIT